MASRITLSEGISCAVYPTHSGLGVTVTFDTIVDRKDGGHAIFGSDINGMDPRAVIKLADELRDCALGVLGKASAEDAERMATINAMRADEREVA